jgi:putative SOS response-associated peptidase YedK
MWSCFEDRAMCNYFTRHREPRNIQAAFRFPEIPNDAPRYVVRPTNTERVVSVGKDGERHFVPMRWGLVPFWAKDIKMGLTLFNWRSENVMAKRTFAEPFKRGRRCLVPCDGFFEFTGERGAKQPYLFRPKDGRLMAFAGLWEQWRGGEYAPPAEPLLSFSIATTSPNKIAAPIHDRMPVLFTDESEWDAWLDPVVTPDDLAPLLAPADDRLLEAFPVTRDMLRIKQPGPDVLDRIAL